MAEDERENERRDDRVLPARDLRRSKPSRMEFASWPRNPITVVLDGVRQNYNLGAFFRLCDAFLAERLVICGAPVILHKRKLVQAAAGTQHWVPWQQADDAMAVVQAAKEEGCWVGAVEISNQSVDLAALRPTFPAMLVLGGESAGMSRSVIASADQMIAIQMLGMANSLNVATAGAIVLHELTRRYRAPSGNAAA